ncbi:hypothetical protein [Nostoc sp.]|uniref:hypothetical protein n=1 Tax=Nostoc sp. TaxID=1180 RepID=UPI002FF588D5
MINQTVLAEVYRLDTTHSRRLYLYIGVHWCQLQGKHANIQYSVTNFARSPTLSLNKFLY